MQEKITVVTVTYNAARHLERFLQSLIRNKESIEEVIFVDNGSKDSTQEVITTLDGVLPYCVIANEKNIGYAAGINLGIEKARQKSAYILVTNNDIEIQTGGLATLLSDAIATDADVVGIPTTNDGHRYHVQDRYDEQSKDFVSSSPIAVAELERIAESEKTKDSFYVHGGVILFRESFFKKIGLYDPWLFFGGDEADFHYRILESKEKIKAVISLRAYNMFDHFTYHDGRFKLLKAKMIMRGEMYVLMKHDRGIFTAVFYRNMYALIKSLSHGKPQRIFVLLVLGIRALVSNLSYLATHRRAC